LRWYADTKFAECKESKACAPFKHHFDECVERVTGADEGKPVDKKHPNEDCVEECKGYYNYDIELSPYPRKKLANRTSF